MAHIDTRCTGDELQTGVAVIAAATFIIAGSTLLHSAVGMILLLYLWPIFVRPGSLREEVLHSATFALAVVMVSAPAVRWILKSYGRANEWQLVLICEWLLVGIVLWVLKMACERNRLKRLIGRIERGAE